MMESAERTAAIEYRLSKSSCTPPACARPDKLSAPSAQTSNTLTSARARHDDNISSRGIVGMDGIGGGDDVELPDLRSPWWCRRCADERLPWCRRVRFCALPGTCTVASGPGVVSTYTGTAAPCPGLPAREPGSIAAGSAPPPPPSGVVPGMRYSGCGLA